MDLSLTYIRYGVSADIAADLAKKGIALSTFKNTSVTNLIKNYQLESTIIEFVNSCIKRQPIDQSVVQDLLEKSNFVCCICKGQKSDGYIIHHIVEYSITQDNSFDNLAVLCPNDHDLAHRQGISLTNRITENQIRQCKEKWQNEVCKQNALRASQGLTEFDRLDKSKITFETQTVSDDQKNTVQCEYPISNRTKLILKVTQTKPEQEFIVYLRILTDKGDEKWIGFGTPMAMKNVFSSERVFRISKPGKETYETVEYITERINESGLSFSGNPVSIVQIRFWGWHNNAELITFDYAILD